MRERKKNRLANFDYSSEAIYFLTSCVQDRLCCLGEIENGKILLNDYGKIVRQQILWLTNRYPYFVIHNYVVMPNHIHILGEISVSAIPKGYELPKNKIKPIPQLMGALKTTSSKQIHLAGFTEFKWQRSYHDHIVRNSESFYRISKYIDNNPRNWDNDKFRGK